jgi:hypothetical protein
MSLIELLLGYEISSTWPKSGAPQCIGQCKGGIMKLEGIYDWMSICPG